MASSRPMSRKVDVLEAGGGEGVLLDGPSGHHRPGPLDCLTGAMLVDDQEQSPREPGVAEGEGGQLGRLRAGNEAQLQPQVVAIDSLHERRRPLLENASAVDDREPIHHLLCLQDVVRSALDG